MIRPPGDRKSLTYIIAGYLSYGVTIAVQPTLSLSADQSSKMRLLSERAKLKVYNLDDYKTSSTWPHVDSKLRSLLKMPGVALPQVFLIVSPQSSSNHEKPWLMQLFLDLADQLLWFTFAATEKLTTPRYTSLLAAQSVLWAHLIIICK